MTQQWHGGKGSTVRPTDPKKYQDGWELAFGKKPDPKVAVDKQLTKEDSIVLLLSQFTVPLIKVVVVAVLVTQQALTVTQEHLVVQVLLYSVTQVANVSI